MPLPSALDICKVDLFSDEADLRAKYPDNIAEKVMRVREIYNLYLSRPNIVDRDVVLEMEERYGVSKVTVYSDLHVVKALLPAISAANREFHRWRYNEMILDTFKTAKEKNDTKTMERAATSYAKNNRVDLEDEQRVPLDQILVQPFTATEDPRVLGIEPIPNLQQRITDMIDKYRKESIDIEDVEYEEADLEFGELFPGDTKVPDIDDLNFEV